MEAEFFCVEDKETPRKDSKPYEAREINTEQSSSTSNDFEGHRFSCQHECQQRESFLVKVTVAHTKICRDRRNSQDKTNADALSPRAAVGRRRREPGRCPPRPNMLA